MKNIKSFKHWYRFAFERFLKEYGYTLDDVKGFSLDDIKRYDGNILKTYLIYFNDDESIYFNVVYFKSFNEYRQSALGFNGNKMSYWYDVSPIRYYKLNGEYVLA